MRSHLKHAGRSLHMHHGTARVIHAHRGRAITACHGFRQRRPATSRTYTVSLQRAQMGGQLAMRMLWPIEAGGRPHEVLAGGVTDYGLQGVSDEGAACGRLPAVITARLPCTDNPG